ncbi:MAG: S26 family signal peptidase [Phycisphaerales bacterium]|nr:S26 family signal peptidase [Phycisphaerales bacterium]
MNASRGQDSAPQSASGIIDTLQSLIVAFVFAMAFRGFILEGFVIPTGSMAPTLMGAHVRLRSPATGYEYAADSAELLQAAAMKMKGDRPIFDPMISRQYPLLTTPNEVLAGEGRMGDRVLVLKYIEPFTAPKRWDVVVFKNPPDPVGEAVYYIKRLVGMPNETLLVSDGDVFTGPLDAVADHLQIERKPEYIQRAVWQPVYDSDYQPIDVARLETALRHKWAGAPWVASDGWSIRGSRAWRSDTPAPTSLTWSNDVIPLDDWNAYNIYRREIAYFPTADLCISAAVSAGDPAAFHSTLDLSARGLLMRFEIGAGEVRLSVTESESQRVVAQATAPFGFPAEDVTNWREPIRLEFWHVDQEMSLFVNGDRVANLPYDLGGPVKRLLASHFGRTLEQVLANPTAQRPTPTAIAWKFDGSPFVLRHIEVKRDLYYRPDFLSANNQFATNGPAISGLAFATDPTRLSRVAAGEYVMFGDNSGASKDSRLWGRPHQLVARELGRENPFVVPREMVIGKAWSVYFPAPLSLSSGGRAFIPDFSRVRFIR